MARAEAAAKYAEREALRFKALGQEGVIAPRELQQVELHYRTSQTELASAQFARRVAQHELELAEAATLRRDGRLGSETMKITSPVAGVVLRVLQESAGAVALGHRLLELGDPRHLEILVDVLTRDAVEIQPEAPVEVHGWGGPILKGQVRRVEPSAFTRLSALGVEEQRVNVCIDLVGSPPGLADGYRVETRIEVYAQEGALIVPSSSVFRREGSWSVFVLRDGRARQTPIEVGRRHGPSVEVTKGLEEGWPVIVHPSDAVADGVRVDASLKEEL